MKAAALSCLVALAACAGEQPPWANPPPVAIDLRLEVSADDVPADDVSADTVVLLQPLRVQLDLFRRADVEVEFTPAVEAGDFLAATETLPEVAFGPGFWQRTILTLRPVRGPGELTLPAFVARAVDGTAQASTPERRLVVESALAGHGAELEAPAAPFPSPPRTLVYVGAGLLLLLLLAGLWWFARRRKAAPSPAAIAQPPHVIALRALERLRSAPRTTPAEIETFYVDVSGVLRHYVEGRFGLHAPERTTEEFLRELEADPMLLREHRSDLRQFLSQCDLVKFARHRPVEQDHIATFAVAEAFVERTRPDRAAVEVTA